MNDSDDIATLAEYLSSVDASALSEPVLENAKACLLYGLAIGIATRHARPARLALSAAARQHEAGKATRLLDAAPSSLGNAAFANAVLLSGRVQGDSHPCGHIGGVVIPAALAAAEDAQATGATLIAALVAGYESALRIGRDHAADLSRRGFRTTPCYGIFGAAIASGRILGFDSARMRNVVGLAANYAGGLREYVDAGTEESPFQAGFAARNAIYVADLVACGLESASSALHGAAGFYRAFGTDGADYGRRLVEGLGVEFEFTTVTCKQYPACQFLRGMIRGLAALRAEAPGAAVDSISVRMHPYEADFIGVRYTGPFKSATQTVMSAPFCAALAWTSGTVSFDGLRRFDNPAVSALIPKISIISDQGRKRYEPLILVKLADGRLLQWAEQSGDSDYRVRWPVATEMTGQLFDEVNVPQSLARNLIEITSRVEQLADVKPLIAAVCAATTH